MFTVLLRAMAADPVRLGPAGSGWADAMAAIAAAAVAAAAVWVEHLMRADQPSDRRDLADVTRRSPTSRNDQ